MFETLRRIVEATGCTILVVHHVGKEATKGARGSSAITGSADFELHAVVERGKAKLRMPKQRDGARLPDMPFRLETVVLGKDKYGENVSTCVVTDARADLNAEGEGADTLDEEAGTGGDAGEGAKSAVGTGATDVRLATTESQVAGEDAGEVTGEGATRRLVDEAFAALKAAGRPLTAQEWRDEVTIQRRVRGIGNARSTVGRTVFLDATKILVGDAKVSRAGRARNTVYRVA